MPEEKTKDERQAMAKGMDLLVHPDGIKNGTPGLIDRQARINSDAVARAIIWDRFAAARFQLMLDTENGKPEDAVKGKSALVDLITGYVNQLDLVTMADHGKNREEILIALEGMKPEKPRLLVENLGSLQLPPSEGSPRDKSKSYANP